MTVRREDSSLIEQTVGARRHPGLHIGRVVTSERRVYIMHSQACLDADVDLLRCPYTVALKDADMTLWIGLADQPVIVHVIGNRLFPRPDLAEMITALDEEVDQGRALCSALCPSTVSHTCHLPQGHRGDHASDYYCWHNDQEVSDG